MWRRELAAFTFEDDRLERARGVLLDWNHELHRDSPAAALYDAWRDALRDQQRPSPTPDAGAAALADLAASHEQALAAALDNLESSQGADWEAWRWGPRNSIAFEHPLWEGFDLPSVDRGGDRTTVNVARPGGGPSFREILDFAEWDRSVATSTPGQSGQPGSPNYGNLRQMWADGEYFPLLYTRDAVESNAAHRLILRPDR